MQAKRQIRHGRLTAWMQSACAFLSLSTARAYMQLARNGPEVQAVLQAKHQPAGVLSIKAALKQIAQDGRRKAPGRPASPEPGYAQNSSGRPPASPGVSPPVGCPAGSEIPAPAGPVEMTPPSQPESAVDVGQGPAGEDPDLLAQVAELASGAVHTVQPDPVIGSLAEEPAAGSDPESGLADADWLETLPLRALLSDSAAYDADAILWRELDAERQRIEQAILPTEADRRPVLTQQWRHWSFRTLAAHFVGVRHPREWKACFRCGGSGKSRALGGHCFACGGSGYELAHEIEPSQAVGCGAEMASDDQRRTLRQLRQSVPNSSSRRGLPAEELTVSSHSILCIVRSLVGLLHSLLIGPFRDEDHEPTIG